MKVLIVFPRMKYSSGDPPLGVAYIASYLREKIDDIEVKILDTTFNSSWEWVKKSLEKEEAEIVGIYAMTPMIKDAYKIAVLAKENGTKLIILGGPHPSVMPEKTLEECKAVDAVIIGEGEYSFCEVVKRYSVKRDVSNLKSIPNLVVRRNVPIMNNNKRFFIQNLDSIPFPAWDLLEMKKYIDNWFQMDAVSSNLKGTNIMGSRGCPYECTFCQPILNKIFSKKLRIRSPENVVKELIELKERYKINSFAFMDDTIFINKMWMENFTNLLKESDLNVLWSFNTRANLIRHRDQTLLKKMYNVGLRLICIGIESGSQRVLDKIYNKKITIEEVKKSVNILKKVNIRIRGFFIVGAPTETEKEIRKTISLANSLKIDESIFSILVPLPGSKVWEMAKEKGWCIKTDWNEIDYYAHSGFLNNLYSERKLRLYQRLGLISFYLHPYRWKYLLNSVKSPSKSMKKIKTYFI